MDKVVVQGPGMFSISSGGGALGGGPGAAEQVDFDSLTQNLLRQVDYEDLSASIQGMQ